MTFEEKDALTRKIVTTLSAVCPIGDCSFGRLTDKATWKVPPLLTATAAQKTALAAAIVSMDVSVAAVATLVTAAQRAAAAKLFTGDDPNDVRFRALARATLKLVNRVPGPDVTWPQFKAAILAEMSSDDPTT